MIDPSLLPASGSVTGVVEEVLGAAFIHAEDGAWDEAARVLREALEVDPDEPHVLCWLGVVERELGMEGVAYERFKRFLSAGSEDPLLLTTAGVALAAFDDPSAESALRTAALLAPQLPKTRCMYGAYLSREGWVERALEELDAAAELDSEDPMIQTERGVAQALKGDLESASLSFARSVELDPGNGWALVLLGLTALRCGEMEESVRALEEGARIRPDDLEAQLLAALVLSAGGWEERALEMLERARLSAEGVDRALVDHAEAQIEDGSASSLEFLQDSLGPSSLRERLMVRPG